MTTATELAHAATPEGHIRAALMRVPERDQIELLRKVLSELIVKQQRRAHERGVA